MLCNVQVQEQEVMKNIFRFLEQFGMDEFDEFRILYSAIYYLYKIKIVKYPKESIVFYAYGSYMLATKSLDFKNKKNTPEYIFELYNNSKLQNNSSILTDFTNTLSKKIPKNEFCYFFKYEVQFAESDLVYLLNFSFSVKNPYDYIGNYISIILKWKVNQFHHEKIYKELYEEAESLLNEFRNDLFFYITRPEIVAIVAISISINNFNINFNRILGGNPLHFFFEFLLPNCQKEEINSQINKVTEIVKIKFPELFQIKKLNTCISEFDLNENTQIFPLEIPTYVDLCCPPPPLEMLKELLADQMSDYIVWPQKQPDIPPPDIDYLYQFRNQESVENCLIDNLSMPDYYTDSNVSISMSHQLNRAKFFFSQLIKKINMETSLCSVKECGNQAISMKSSLNTAEECGNQAISMKSSLNTAKECGNQAISMKSSLNTAEECGNQAISMKSSLSNANETEIQENNKLQADNNKFSYSFYATARKFHSMFAYETYAQLKQRLINIYPFLSNVSDEEFKDRCTSIFSMKTYLKNDPSKTDVFEQFQQLSFIPKRVGRWSDTDTIFLIEVIKQGSFSGVILDQKGNIKWDIVADYMLGRDLQSCKDKYKQLKKKKDPRIENIHKYQSKTKSYEYNPIFYSAFTQEQEDLLFDNIKVLLDQNQLVTMNIISYLAKQIYYSPLNLTIKALILKSLKDKKKPFDENGNIIIPDFESKLEPLLDLANNEPHQIMNEYGIKEFVVSKSWVYKFMLRHGLVFRKVHYERRGKIDEKQVDRYLTEIADAVMLYGEDKILNMDETFISTWNPPNKVIGEKGKETIKVTIENVNAKEGTTFIGTVSMNPKIHIPLSLIAKGKTAKCEKKYGTEISEELITHSQNGWMTPTVMIAYLRWLKKNGECIICIDP